MISILHLLFVFAAYLIGSLSSAILVCKALRLPDPRTQGSNNPGATNVLRIGGKFSAFLTLMGDILKGFIPVLLALHYHLNSSVVSLIALAAFFGHLFPIFFKFQGGKGVATLIGCLFALSPFAGLCYLATWLTMVGIFRYSSLASLTATILAPLYLGYFTHNKAYVLACIVMTICLIYRHESNIQKLIYGQEKKIGTT